MQEIAFCDRVQYTAWQFRGDIFFLTLLTDSAIRSQ